MIGPMDFILNGYGRMGREVEQILQSRGHNVAARIDPVAAGVDGKVLTKGVADRAELVIEFSLPESVPSNADLYAEFGISAVVGTTGWSEHIESVEQKVKSSGIGYLYGFNFSLGAHIFFALAEKAAALINPFPEYDISLFEIHHAKKKDSPSGTAFTAGEKIIGKIDRKKIIHTDRLDRSIKPEELHVASMRGGYNPGCHTVILDSLADSLEIKHAARNRSGFALGAVIAAEWLGDKKGFYNIEETMKELLK